MFSLLDIIVFIIIVIVIVFVLYLVVRSIDCNMFLKSILGRNTRRENLAHASWDTLERAHPALADLLKSHQDDSVLFSQIDALLSVQTWEEFNQHAKRLVECYPDFKTHMDSIAVSNEETWHRFLKHRALAKVVFASLRSK